VRRCVFLPELLHQRDRLAVERVEPVERVTDLGRPVRARPPGGCLEDEADAALAREDGVGRVVEAELVGALVVLEQVEGSECRQLEAVMENERCLEAAVSDEKTAVELRQAPPVHGPTLPAPGMWARDRP